MVLSGLKLLMMQERENFNLSSQKMFSRFWYLFRYLESQHRRRFARIRPTSRYHGEQQYTLEKEITSTVWMDYGDTGNENWYLKKISDMKNYRSIAGGVRVEI